MYVHTKFRIQGCKG